MVTNALIAEQGDLWVQCGYWQQCCGTSTHHGACAVVPVGDERFGKGVEQKS